MRAYGALSPTDQIELPPDTIHTLLIAAGTPQAMDWAGSTVGAASAGAHLARFSGFSTAGAAINFIVNLISTHAAAPSSGTSITTGTTVGSTGNNVPVQGTRYFQIPPFSTGFSVALLSSGYVFAEVWRK
jgi:hypothetical protein